MLDVICHLQCPVCRRKAVGVTEASAKREVEAYLEHLANLPLAERAEASGRRSPSFYSYKFCLHCQESSKNFLLTTIKSKRTRARVQYVVARPIPFDVPGLLSPIPP